MTMNEIPDRISPKSHMDAQVSSFSNSQKPNVTLSNVQEKGFCGKDLKLFYFSFKTLLTAPRKNPEQRNSIKIYKITNSI